MGRIALCTAAGLYVLSVVLSAGALPTEVPLHFGASGSADRYGSRREALVFLVALGAFLLALWLVLLRCLRRGSLDLVNVPYPAYWKAPEREAELRRRVEVDLTWFFAATVLLTAAIPVSMLSAARGSGDLPWGFGLVFGAYVLGSIVWCIHSYTHRWRPPADASPAGAAPPR